MFFDVFQSGGMKVSKAGNIIFPEEE